MLAGLSATNILNVLKVVTVCTVKGRAALTDIRLMLSKLEGNQMEKAAVWEACESRMDSNRRILEAMVGITSELLGPSARRR